jgi:hypothetical protein
VIAEPVATVATFESVAHALRYRPTVLRLTLVSRSISLSLSPRPNNVRIVIFKCDFKTFTPGPFVKRKHGNVPPQRAFNAR